MPDITKSVKPYLRDGRTNEETRLCCPSVRLFLWWSLTQIRPSQVVKRVTFSRYIRRMVNTVECSNRSSNLSAKLPESNASRISGRTLSTVGQFWSNGLPCMLTGDLARGSCPPWSTPRRSNEFELIVHRNWLLCDFGSPESKPGCAFVRVTLYPGDQMSDTRCTSSCPLQSTVTPSVDERHTQAQITRTTGMSDLRTANRR